MSFYIAIDQGTTGTTACLVDQKSLKFIDKHNLEFKQIFPSPGLVEHDLNEIWSTVEKTISTLLERNEVSPNDIKAIGITNQRETTCAFNKSGKPLHHAIVWQDRRTSKFCEDLKSHPQAEKIKNKTGLTLDPYFSGSKMNWLLENSKEVQDSLASKDLLFGTIDTFLLYKLSGNQKHATEASNSSRTLLMNIHSGDWDEELCQIFEVPMETLPSIEDSFGVFAKTQGLSFLPDGIPVSGILGDQQSALFGQGCFDKGGSKCTYGTGAFMLLNTGEEPIKSKNGLLTTIAYREDSKLYYALEGSSYIAGAAVQWLRDNLNLIETSQEIEELAKKATEESCKNLVFYPFFSGIGSPHWVSEAKGAIIGLSRDSSKEQIARACLEGIALSINDLVQAMISDTNIQLDELKVDGGAVANNLLMEFQACFSNLNVIRPKVIETTAYGAVLAAAVGIGQLDKSDLKDFWEEEKVFKAQGNEDYYNSKKDLWEKYIQKIFL